MTPYQVTEALIDRQRTAIATIEKSIGSLLNLPEYIIKLIVEEDKFEHKVELLEASAKIVGGQTK